MTTTEETYDTDVVLPNPADDRSVFQRVLAIIDELPAIGKTQRNEQQQFMFRGHDDVMNALNPLLAKHGVFIVPTVRDRVTSERQTSRGATMYEVNLHVRFTFYGADGDSFDASGWGEGTDMGDKATSKAMTMAFKYVVAEVFALATAEVSDADSGSPEETNRGAAAAAPRQRAEGRKRPKAEFDPGKHLLPTAMVVRTEEDADALRRATMDYDPTQPWSEVEEFVILHLFGKPYAELDGKQKREYYTRFANAVVKAEELAGPGGDFPPVTLDQIAAAWKWAFKDISIAFPEPLPASEDEPDQEPASEEASA